MDAGYSTAHLARQGTTGAGSRVPGSGILLLLPCNIERYAASGAGDAGKADPLAATHRRAARKADRDTTSLLAPVERRERPATSFAAHVRSLELRATTVPELAVRLDDDATSLPVRVRRHEQVTVSFLLHAVTLDARAKGFPPLSCELERLATSFPPDVGRNEQPFASFPAHVGNDEQLAGSLEPVAPTASIRHSMERGEPDAQSGKVVQGSAREQGPMEPVARGDAFRSTLLDWNAPIIWGRDE